MSWLCGCLHTHAEDTQLVGVDGVRHQIDEKSFRTFQIDVTADFIRRSGVILCACCAAYLLLGAWAGGGVDVSPFCAAIIVTAIVHFLPNSPLLRSVILILFAAYINMRLVYCILLPGNRLPTWQEGYPLPYAVLGSTTICSLGTLLGLRTLKDVAAIAVATMICSVLHLSWAMNMSSTAWSMYCQVTISSSVTSLVAAHHAECRQKALWYARMQGRTEAESDDSILSSQISYFYLCVTWFLLTFLQAAYNAAIKSKVDLMPLVGAGVMMAMTMLFPWDFKMSRSTRRAFMLPGFVYLMQRCLIGTPDANGHLREEFSPHVVSLPSIVLEKYPLPFALIGPSALLQMSVFFRLCTTDWVLCIATMMSMVVCIFHIQAVLREAPHSGLNYSTILVSVTALVGLANKQTSVNDKICKDDIEV